MLSDRAVLNNAFALVDRLSALSHSISPETSVDRYTVFPFTGARISYANRNRIP
ncbi:hypothetical protein [Roseofilum capinflatum]|uniref:Uncharacterized protein n=1 Tax=Roseofilum capinflatum BLCC-M114 TaxID=3022440 RepID=A0ABT7B680_9CYAN|nr:hypothetical protein [Roseofilum capinflatum]MDJ1174675.1 hypothetical protein [Roseofilum capinflatum BLCC-M114]